MRHFRSVGSIGAILALISLAPPPVQGRTLQQVQEMIRAQGLHWEAAHTSRSDIPWDEFKQTLTFRIPPGYAALPKVDLARSRVMRESIPASWDWRANHGVTAVKDQGSCGSCWAFASVGALEANLLVNDQTELDLSEQEVLSCNQAMEGCNGGWFDAAFDVFHRLGAISEDCQPYEAADGVACSAGVCPVQAWGDSLIWLDPSVESIKAAVLKYGPVACGMAVVDDFMHYHGGCYSSNSNAEINHAVVIVGWDDNECGGSWICKNSWGLNWGEGGFFHITYNCCQIGYGAALFQGSPQNAVQVSVEPLPTTCEDPASFPLAAQVDPQTPSPINPDSVFLHFRVNGGDWSQRQMSQNGRTGLWEGALPGPAKPATLEYFVTAANMDHRTGRAPHGSAQAVYSFDLSRYYEDFEGDCPGWTVGDPHDTAVSGVWTCVAPVGSDAQPGSNHTPGGSRCFVTGQGVPAGNLGDNDVDGGATTLYSPVYDLQGSPTAIVKYWRWFSNDRGMNPGTDPWVVQVRADNGNWIDIEHTTVSSDAWIQVSTDLHQILGPILNKVQFRFVAADYDPPSIVEAALDDFEIYAEDRGVTSTRTLVGVSAPLAPAAPNPLTPGVALRISCPGGVSEVGIFDPTGREIRRLSVASRPQAQIVSWDGRDGRGRVVPAGSYLYVLGAGAEAQRGRVTVIR